ncbi:ankyrin repeat domain-containing protein [Endozoicomonas sp. ONNA2]|uniref:ankyrin repeat domain-containing protein n=1 Tax=Endozoicomonas sp. ONNA2 TaxID=2828741 RepID=UPI0021474F8F|nr:ankyrin repeat domain-containing protein [Endozoicomonas sp. ONNA2]
MMNKLASLPFFRSSHENPLINHDPSDPRSCLVKTKCGHVFALENITNSFNEKKLEDRRCSRCKKLALPLKVLEGCPDKNNPYCLSPALEAAGKGDIKTLKLLLDCNPDVAKAIYHNPPHKNEITLLHAAASHGQVSAVKLLLEYGATPNSRTSTCLDTPLINAVLNGHHQVIDLLAKYENETPVNFPDHFFDDWYLPPLIFARDIKSAQILVNHKADVNARAYTPGWIQEHNMTPLLIAARDDNASLVEFLVQHGADVNAAIFNNATKNGLTPLSTQNGNAYIVECPLQNGAYVDAAMDCATDNYDATPLLIASRRGHTQVVSILLKYGANVNVMVHAENERGLTPLIAAATHGCHKTVQLLLKNNADANAVVTGKDLEGCSALWLAACNGHHKIVELLLKYKADPHVIDKKGRSAYDAAIKEKHHKIAKLLKEHGATTNTPKNQTSVKSASGEQKPLIPDVNNPHTDV